MSYLAGGKYVTLTGHVRHGALSRAFNAVGLNAGRDKKRLTGHDKAAALSRMKYRAEMRELVHTDMIAAQQAILEQAAREAGVTVPVLRAYHLLQK